MKITQINLFLKTENMVSIPKKLFSKDLVRITDYEGSHPEKHLDVRYGTKDYLLIGNILNSVELRPILKKQKAAQKYELITTFDKPVEMSSYARSFLPDTAESKAWQMCLVLISFNVHTVNFLTGYYTDPKITREKRRYRNEVNANWNMYYL
jgi:hypothetical protein